MACRYEPDEASRPFSALCCGKQNPANLLIFAGGNDGGCDDVPNVEPFTALTSGLAKRTIWP